MSTKALSWGIEQRTGSPARKAILLLICDLADESLSCYPGREYLAERSELSPRTVQQALTDLTAAGFLRVLRRAKRGGGRRTNRYLVCMYGADTPLPDIDDWSGEFVPGVDDSAGDGKGESAAPLPDGADDSAGESNGAAGAPFPAEQDQESNSAADAHLTEQDPHIPYKEDDPLGVDQRSKISPPPGPTVTHSPAADSEEEGRRPDDGTTMDDPHAAYVDAARDVLRQVTRGVEAARTPRGPEADRLVSMAIEAMRRGWSAGDLAARLTAEPLASADSVYAVVSYRIRNAGDPPPPRPAAGGDDQAPEPLPPAAWCGDVHCDKTTRTLVDDEQRPKFVADPTSPSGRRRAWCPTCSPQRVPA